MPVLFVYRQNHLSESFGRRERVKGNHQGFLSRSNKRFYKQDMVCKTARSSRNIFGKLRTGDARPLFYFSAKILHFFSFLFEISWGIVYNRNKLRKRR